MRVTLSPIGGFEYRPGRLLERGDVFRIVGGGMEYRGQRLQPIRGLLRVLWIGQRGQRVYVECCECSRLDGGRQYTIYVAGPAYRHRLFDGIRVKPYRVRKARPETVARVQGLAPRRRAVAK